MKEEMNGNTALALFEPANVRTIVELCPTAYRDNALSHTRCTEAGKALLQRVESEGMGDGLDQAIATYIEKAKRTYKAMNDRRSPVTKLFDQLRQVYTAMENEVDPSKPGNIPGKLQAYRNAYAAKKREEERRRLEEERRQKERQLAEERYRSDLAEDYKRQFNALLTSVINDINETDRGITLQNYEATQKRLAGWSVKLPQQWEQQLRSAVALPSLLGVDECRKYQAQALQQLLPQFAGQYEYELRSTLDDILDRLPSKRRELQKIAQADAEEAARIKAEMDAKEAEMARQREAGRLEKQRQEEAARQLEAQKQEMDGLFGLTAQSESYVPRTQVRKRIVVERPEDIMKILGFWMCNVGKDLPLDELAKTFKKMITYAEKMANDKNAPVTLDGVRYEDEVKAK